ncbi:MAG: hypothetical protein DRI65_00345 [Chloroflexota bacterium]|nr:MAG: hypothetical protein DRI65_00345 [Chloroflexota bacterium]
MKKESADRFIKRNEQNIKFDERFLSLIVLLLAILLGIIVRWNFIAGSEFPINDGGFFYTMVSDLIANNFRLPKFTSYNLAEIPFAYPPLAFYLIGGINKITRLPIIELIHYLPFGISILTIPAFYFASKIFFPEELFYRALATYIFATLPRTFEWFVMGGGITRSLGFIFALLALAFYTKATRDHRGGIDFFLAALCSSLTALSHPVALIFLAFSIAIITIYFWSAKITYPLILGVLVVLFTSPWWVTVLINNGLDPFIGASNTGHMNWFDVGYLITQNFDFENRFFLRLISFLAIMGLFSKQKRKAFFLGVLVGVGYLFVPRGGVDLLTTYLALLGTLGFATIVEAWGKDYKGNENIENEIYRFDRKSRILLLYLIIYSFIGAYSYKYVDGKVDLHLSEGEYQAMIWIRENSAKTETVVHLPPNSSYQDWWNDYFGEWLPGLTERHSIATVQGHEWLPGEFNHKIEQYGSLRNCSVQGVDCVEEWIKTFGNEFDYLLLNQNQHPKIVLDNFLCASWYSVVYENEDVVILKRE